MTFEAYAKYSMIKQKIDKNETCTADEIQFMQTCGEYIERQIEKDKYEQERPQREARNRKYAIERAMKKWCPYKNSNCIGEQCAIFKVYERRATIDEWLMDRYDKQYDALCGNNAPIRGSKIERR